MKFQSNGRQYSIDEFGCIIQTDAKLHIYDHTYAHCYDGIDYVRESEKLQALRYGFLSGAHGQIVNSLLDFGYGNGAFITFIKNQTKVTRVYGYDVTGFPVPGCEIVDDPKIPVDVVTFWDVLEHIKDFDFLRHLKARTLVTSMPYCHFPETYSQKWFDEFYPHRKPDEHVRHFNSFSLIRTMAHYGWGLVAESDYENIVRKRSGAWQNILSMAFRRF
jgi:hypothetical protein